MSRAIILSLTSFVAAACGGVTAPVPVPSASGIRDAGSWAIQLQGIEAPGAVERLARADVDLIVLDPVTNVRGREDYPISAVVDQLHTHPGRKLDRKLVLAYLNVGEAESYRAYWQANWTAPADGRSGSPEFLVAEDPDGWAGNYPVAFWYPEWRHILEAQLDAIVDAGFDGVFLDWVAAWEEERVRAVAAREGRDPAAAMAELICVLRDRAGGRRPTFVVMGLNAARLVTEHAPAAECLDAVVQEPLSFYGAAGVGWDDPTSADRPVPAEGEWSIAVLLRRLKSCRAAGLTVLTLDYASETANVRRAEELSRSNGFVPFVTRSSLDRLPAAVRLQR